MLDKINEGGSDVDVEPLSVDANGTYTAPSGTAYSPVTVNVPTGGGGDNYETIVSMANYGACYNSTVSAISQRAFMGASYIKTAQFTNVQTIGTSAFASCAIVSASFPVCETIGDYAFYNCSSMLSMYAPECTFISDEAFSACYGLSSISFPVCRTIGQGAFQNTRVQYAYMPECTRVSSRAFYMASVLQIADMPNVETIGSEAFYGCSALQSANYSALRAIGRSAFQRCINLETVILPALEKVTTYAFAEASKLSNVRLNVCSEITSSAFTSCRMLLSLYMLSTSVPTLYNSNAFWYTPINGYTVSTSDVLGSIFVRASLLTTFQTASNWSYYSERMVGLTDEEIEALDAQEGANTNAEVSNLTDYNEPNDPQETILDK